MDNIQIQCDLDFTECVKNFTHLNDLTDKLNSQEDYLKFLAFMRWGNKPKCVKCHNDENNYYLTTRQIYKCSKCYKQFSATQGTMFHRSKLPLKNWFKAINIVVNSKNGISSIDLAIEIRTQQKTAWSILQKIRLALAKDNVPKLSSFVQVDETLIGGKPKRDSRLKNRIRKHDKIETAKYGIRKANASNPHQPYHNKKNVVGMLDEYGHLKLFKLGTGRGAASQESIFPLLFDVITKNKTNLLIVTDGSPIYKKLSEYGICHDYVRHNYKAEYIDKRTGKVKEYWAHEYAKEDFGCIITTNRIENVWRWMKVLIEGTHVHCSYKYLDLYLAQVAFRYNRIHYKKKKNTWKPIEEAIKLGILGSVSIT